VADKLEHGITRQGFSGMRFSPIYYRGKDDWLNARANDGYVGRRSRAATPPSSGASSPPDRKV
jgi:hypothetical protein